MYILTYNCLQWITFLSQHGRKIQRHQIASDIQTKDFLNV